MIILISSKSLSRTEKRQLKSNYSLLIYNERLHKQKKYSELGKADILLFELNVSILYKSKTYDYLKYKHFNKDDNVVFVYNEDKYLNKFKFKNVNHYIKYLPKFTGKNLLKEILKMEQEENKQKKKQEQQRQQKKKEVKPVKQDQILELKEQINKLQSKLDDLIKSNEKIKKPVEPTYKLYIEDDIIYVKSNNNILEQHKYKNRIEKLKIVKKLNQKYNL